MISRPLFLSILLMPNLLGMEKSCHKESASERGPILTLSKDIYLNIFCKIMDSFKDCRPYPGYPCETNICKMRIQEVKMLPNADAKEVLRLRLVCKRFNGLLKNDDFIGALIKYMCDSLYIRREAAILKERLAAIEKKEHYIPGYLPPNSNHLVGEAQSYMAYAKEEFLFQDKEGMFDDLKECIERHGTATHSRHLVHKACALKSIAQKWITQFLAANPQLVKNITKSRLLLDQVTVNQLQFFRDIGLFPQKSIDK